MQLDHNNPQTNKTQLIFKNKIFLTALMFAAVMGFMFNAGSYAAKSDNCPQTPPQTPTFNWWPLTFNGNQTCADLPLIDALNTSSTDPRSSRYANNQSEHDAGINGNPGDVIEVSLYVHNGASDQIDRSLTTANNVRMSSQFDVGPTATHTISGSVSASNAATVTSANDGGNIAVHTAAQTTMQYIPGTTKGCVSQDTAAQLGSFGGSSCGIASDGSTRVWINLPDMYSGSASSGSVGLANLKACFPYAAQILYELKIVSTAPTGTALTTTKLVRNTTAGASATDAQFASSTNAHPGDSVQYQITIHNSGTAPATNVFVTDSGAALITPDSNFNGLLTGRNIGTVNANNSFVITYNGIVSSSIQSSIAIQNSANAKADNANWMPYPSIAIVYVTIRPPSGTSLSIIKTVSIHGQNNFQPSVSVNNGAEVDFMIQVKNTGSATANNVIVTDIVPPGLQNVSAPPNLNNGENFGNLAAGQSLAAITFSSIVTSTSLSVTNVANATADNANEVFGSATVYINRPGPQNTTLKIQKLVRNTARNGSTTYTSSVMAMHGDSPEFQITVSNIGSVTANNVLLIDNLPAGLTSSGGISQNLFSSGINVGALTPGQTVTYTFNVSVQTTAFNITLDNVATVSSSNAATESSHAQVIVGQAGKTVGAPENRVM